MTLRWHDLDRAATVQLQGWPAVALLEGPTVAKLLGVGPSTLRNWRHRGQGPKAEPSDLYGRGAPAPVYYRVSAILHWLDGPEARQAWEYERDWLVEYFDGWRFVRPDGVVDVSTTITAQQTAMAAESIRENASDALFNRAAGIADWPARQPRPRRQFS